jgi:hypothetical protein
VDKGRSEKKMEVESSLRPFSCLLFGNYGMSPVGFGVTMHALSGHRLRVI